MTASQVNAELLIDEAIIVEDEGWHGITMTIVDMAECGQSQLNNVLQLNN